MPEHTPAPTPDRAVYGFALYLLFGTLFVVYVIWAFVPQFILEDMLGLTYLPDKYFALYVPILILCATTFFAFFIYPGLNMSLTPNIDDQMSIRDSNSIMRCQHRDEGGRKCDNQVRQDMDSWRVRRFCDIHGKEQSGEGEVEVEEEITNWCDCPSAHNCLLRENSSHVQQLRARTKIPAISDMDLADVCKEVFGK